jgi:hypothetical protein
LTLTGAHGNSLGRFHDRADMPNKGYARSESILSSCRKVRLGPVAAQLRRLSAPDRTIGNFCCQHPKRKNADSETKRPASARQSNETRFPGTDTVIFERCAARRGVNVPLTASADPYP